MAKNILSYVKNRNTTRIFSTVTLLQNQLIKEFCSRAFCMNLRNTIEDEQHKFLRETKRVENIKQYVLENLSSNLHANIVAAKFNISISSLHHLFKRYLAQSYHKYLEDIRMTKAYELLQQDGMSVKEAMFATGYKNRGTFNNAFKKRFQRSPGYFKK